MQEETGWCMPSLGASLFWIIGCAVVAPLFAGLVPRKLVPEVVLLLGATGVVHAQTAVASEPGVLVAFVALIAGTGLPVIVAVTGVAVESGDMTAANASVLVAAGAITVLLFPLGASLIDRSAPGTGPLGPAEATDCTTTSEDNRGADR